ncbi:MAG: class I SAM-dependent methyltransferase [Candidatus Thorarchaeota archaeon]|jgi:ubiquinone/menaquinone biosynthesis C-methylase UbiE
MPYKGNSTHEKSIDYDSVSRIYDEVRTGDPEMIHQLLQGAPLKSSALVLDIGCGTANNTLLFSKTSGTKVTGLDFSFGMLKKARKKTEGIELVHAPATALPFSDEIFDFVFMTEVVHHLSDVKSALEEMQRVVSSPGASCIVTQSHEQITERMTSKFFPATVEIDQERYPSIIELEANLDQAGFEKITPRIYKFAPIRLGQDYLETVEKRGYSMLHKIRSSEYDEGLAQLRKALAQEHYLDYSAGYTFVWAFK